MEDQRQRRTQEFETWYSKRTRSMEKFKQSQGDFMDHFINTDHLDHHIPTLPPVLHLNFKSLGKISFGKELKSKVHK